MKLMNWSFSYIQKDRKPEIELIMKFNRHEPIALIFKAIKVYLSKNNGGIYFNRNIRNRPIMGMP